MKKLRCVKPTIKELNTFYQEKMGNTIPKNKEYICKEPNQFRPVAEYEDMGGVIFSYIGTKEPKDKHKQLPPRGERTFGVPNELIVLTQQNDSEKPVHTFIFCDDEKQLEPINASLQKTADEMGVKFNPGHVHLIPWDTDTYWTRDFAPWWLYNEATKEYGIAKHIYTSLGGGTVGLVEGSENAALDGGTGIFRGNDDYGAVKLADFLNAPIRQWNNAKWHGQPNKEIIPENKWFFTGMLHVGGNYMCTTDGRIASSYLAATQNELPSDEYYDGNITVKSIDMRMKYIMEQSNRFLGAQRYYALVDPTGTYIGHIDCWGKFLSDNLLLLAESNDKTINKGLDEISNFLTKCYENDGMGSTLTVKRVKCPDIYVPNGGAECATTAPYTNSLILNNCVYVPIADKKYENANRAALEVYKEAYPKNYKIYGIRGKKETPWLGTDALHCRTNAIPRKVVDRWLKSQELNIDKMEEPVIRPHEKETNI